MQHLTSDNTALFQTELYSGFFPLKYPKDKTMVDLFEEQVKKTPDNVALIFNSNHLSYKELNSISNQLADYLRKTYPIQPDDLVGIMLDRSEWMMITMLAILKAGAGYVPIALDYPQERISYLVNDSRCKVLIDDAELNKFKFSQSDYSKANPSTGLSPNNLMYCIYTSGSTGLPKGVLVEHTTVVNLVYAQKAEFKITSYERILQFSSISFDASVEQIWLAFLSGAALVIISQDMLGDIKALEKYITENKVSHIHTVPAYLNELVIEDKRYLKRMIAGGDLCPPHLAERWQAYCAFYNEYGPTETTVTSIEYKASKNDGYNNFVPVGKPIANTHIYILDDEKQLAPYGSLGEVYIGGDGVARGYLNRPELTAERFIANPFEPGQRMYRTGDLGRWLPDGNIEYLGRIDEQVKIRGFRIELGEISSVLQKSSKVKDAVVIAASINGQEKELIAYTSGEAETEELVGLLKSNLPHYMVPAYFVKMDVFPLNKNGKIDRKALPMPTERYHQKQQNFAAPVSETEKNLAVIWHDVLNINQIGIDDNFFDLGGTSLMVMRLINQVNEKTKSSLRLASLYQLPTIRQLAQKIDEKTTAYISPIVLLKKGEGTPLFIFPPWSSYPTIFNEFVNTWSGKNPLYGIIYTEDTEDFPFKDLQEYVQFLIGHIKEIHPEGPYGLLGYSLGARTVLEVGIQLQKGADEVKLLSVISHYPSFPEKKLLLSRRLRDEIRVFKNISIGLKAKYLQKRLPYFLKLAIRGNNDIQHIILEIDSQQKILSIHEEYVSNDKFNGDLVLIYEKSPDGHPSEFKKVQVYRNSIFKKLWKPHINGEVIVKNVETKHIDFFKQPAVSEVTAIVQSHL
ncbi:MAG TPA: amino acid adenylation domain-containing protein [Mucilaginibacter sp.]|jgi:amino acid adenylation domain-containing protein|nr:amino acid adenylation domain-containing protein [Mucilaginibacter sp.]